MFERIKSMIGGPSFSKQQIEDAQHQALEAIKEGDAPAGVESMAQVVRQVEQAAPSSPLLAHAYYNMAVVYLVAGQDHLAADSLRKASDIPGTDHESRKDRLTYLMNLGDVLTRMGETQEAETYLRTGLTEREAFYEENHPGVAFGLTPLAANLYKQGRAAEALPLIDRAVAINSAAGQAEVVDDLALRSFIVKAAHGPQAPAFAFSRMNEDLQKALVNAVLQRAVEIEEKEEAAQALLVLDELSTLPLPDLDDGTRLNLLALGSNLACLAEDHRTRLGFTQRALELAKTMGKADVIVNMYEGLALAYGDMGQTAEVEQTYRVAFQEAKSAGDAQMIANVLRNLGLWYSEQERHDDASKTLKQAVEAASRVTDGDIRGRCLVALGIYLQHQKQLEPARRMLQDSVSALELTHPDRFCAMSHLIALENGEPCPCDGEAHGQAASRILEEIVRRSAPPDLLESLSLDGGKVSVSVTREPTQDEVMALNRLIETALGQMRGGLGRLS